MTSASEPRRLAVIGPDDVLAGVAPVPFERAGKLCEVGDHTHRGLLRVAAQVADHGLRRVVAPSGRAALEQGLRTACGWASAAQDLRAVRQQRSECYASFRAIEATTVRAVRASVASLPAQAGALEAHADSVVWRYVRLAVRLAVEAVVLTLDGVTTPASLAPVVQHVAAARAYQATALGAGRNPDLLIRAKRQAEFEAEDHGDGSHTPDVLALQLLHEYLGVRWKVLHDAERATIDEFVSWAISGDVAR